jgi:acetate kinase
MGGIDAVVFTGGIGENSSRVREHALKELNFLGIEIDDALNSVDVKGEREISAKESKVKIFVIPTNEELVIAIDTMRIVKEKN